MDDKIINFAQAKTYKAKSDKYFATEQKMNVSVAHEVKNLYFNSTKEILDEWRNFAVTNSLNKFIIQSLSDRLIDKTIDYISDLNAISRLEKQINLGPVVLSPATTVGNSLGWGAGFYLNGILYSTPEFDSENYARCFNIILFVTMKKGLKSNTN